MDRTWCDEHRSRTVASGAQAPHVPGQTRASRARRRRRPLCRIFFHPSAWDQGRAARCLCQLKEQGFGWAKCKNSGTRKESEPSIDPHLIDTDLVRAILVKSSGEWLASRPQSSAAACKKGRVSFSARTRHVTHDHESSVARMYDGGIAPAAADVRRHHTKANQ